MSRFHFHLQDDHFYPDEEGMELADLKAARSTAIRMTAELLSDHLGDFWDGRQWKLEVTDDQGSLLFALSFSASDAPVVARYFPPRQHEPD